MSVFVDYLGIRTMINIQFLQPLELLLQLIFQQYFNESYCLTVVSDSMLNAHIISTSMTYLRVNYSSEQLVQQILAVSEMGCSDYIIQMSEPDKFMSAYEQVNRLGNARRGDRKLIFLLCKENYDIIATKVLTHGETAFITNLLLISPVKSTGHCETYNLVTHKFVGPDVEINDPVLLDHWNSCNKEFDWKSNLFPNKLQNMRGKSLRVAAFTYEPYVILDLEKSVEPSGFDGTEMRIVDEFCRWLNCTLKVVRDDVYEWGDIFENGTGNGVLGNVAEDRADLGISVFLSMSSMILINSNIIWLRQLVTLLIGIHLITAALYSWYGMYTHLDFSASCIRSGISCIAPAPKSLASWELPLLPFSWVMWITLFFTFIYASIAMYIVHGFSTDKMFITTFGMMVTQSQKDAGSNWRVRSITGWLLVTGLVLDNAYGGGLASTLTVPRYEKSIDTVQDIVDRKMPWGATHDAWIFSLVLSKDPKIMQLVSQFRTYEADILKKKSFTRSMAFSIEKLPAGYFAIGNYITKEAAVDMQLMLEEFYYEYTVVMARKSSPYIEKVTELIGRLHETGMMQAWEKQIALKYLDYEVQLEVKLSRNVRDVDIDSLGFHQVVGIFIVYITGVAFSVLLFLLELFIAASNRK